MKAILIILLSFLSHSVYAQNTDSSFILIRSIPGDIAGAAIDNLDNIYIISSSGQIKKLNSKGDSVAVYNQVRNFGRIHSIDVSNPMKPVLFYKDFSSVVILDRLLAVRTTIDLRRFSILQPGAVGLSYDNNLWVFDEYDNKLKKIDEQGKKLLETPDLRNVFTTTVQPQKIIDENGMVYLADTSRGVFVFDNYGSFKRRVAFKKSQNIEVIKGTIFGTGNNEIIIYNPTTFSESSKAFPSSFSPYLFSTISNSRLLILSKERLQIYQFTY